MSPSPRFKEQERFTYADYLSWSDEERWELIEGVPNSMSAAPSRLHQEISGNIHGYQRVGILEYWLVNQTDKTLMLFKLNAAGEYGRPEMYGSRDIVAVPLLGNLGLIFQSFFLRSSPR